MSAADSIRNFIAPLLVGWRIQAGRWTDGSKTDRYAVIQHNGGRPVELLRRPVFSLILIGAENDSVSVPSDAAEVVIEAMRATSGELIFMQPGEPVFRATDDGRPAFEIAIAAITD